MIHPHETPESLQVIHHHRIIRVMSACLPAGSFGYGQLPFAGTVGLTTSPLQVKRALNPVPSPVSETNWTLAEFPRLWIGSGAILEQYGPCNTSFAQSITSTVSLKQSGPVKEKSVENDMLMSWSDFGHSITQTQVRFSG